MTAETPAPEADDLPPVPQPPASEPQAPPFVDPSNHRAPLGQIVFYADDGPLLFAIVPRHPNARPDGETYAWNLANDHAVLPEGMDAAIVRGMLRGALARLTPAPKHPAYTASDL